MQENRSQRHSSGELIRNSFIGGFQIFFILEIKNGNCSNNFFFADKTDDCTRCEVLSTNQVTEQNRYKKIGALSIKFNFGDASSVLYIVASLSFCGYSKDVD